MSRHVDILGVDISAPTRHNDDIIIPTFQIWITFSPIADTAVPYYSIDAFRLNVLVLVFAIASVPFGFLASWLLDTLGLRWSVSFTELFFIELHFTHSYHKTHKRVKGKQ